MGSIRAEYDNIEIFTYTHPDAEHTIYYIPNFTILQQTDENRSKRYKHSYLCQLLNCYGLFLSPLRSHIFRRCNLKLICPVSYCPLLSVTALTSVNILFKNNIALFFYARACNSFILRSHFSMDKRIIFLNRIHWQNFLLHRYLFVNYSLKTTKIC